MIKRTIKEIVEEFDDTGKLVRRTTTETAEYEENTLTTPTAYPSWYPDGGSTGDPHDRWWEQTAVYCEADPNTIHGTINPNLKAYNDDHTGETIYSS